MAKSPTCCLYWSFLLHFSAFGALLAGYSTPYWTRIKMSTGEVRSLGLVVSCDRHKCDLLTVTSARSIFIVVFGMCTFSILLSLCSIQVLCLALYNRSCREKNVGTCLSYLSLVTAFSIGGTLGLYQIDVQEEDQPDVVYMWMDWSQYCVMGACGGFFLGTWLDVLDHCLRDRSTKRELIKKAEVKAKVAANGIPLIVNPPITSEPQKNHHSTSSERRQEYANKETWRSAVNKSTRDPRLYSTVETAVNIATSRGSLRRANGIVPTHPSDRRGSNDRRASNAGIGGTVVNRDTRNAAAKDNRVKSINVKEAPTSNATSGSNTKVISVSSSDPSGGNDRSQRRPDRPPGAIDFSEAAIKYRQQSAQNTGASAIEDRKTLEAVPEDGKVIPRENQVSTKIINEKRVLNRQNTKTLVGHTILHTTDMLMGKSNRVKVRDKEDTTKEPEYKLPTVENIVARPSISERGDMTSPISRHSRPHPLQRDGPINSIDNSFDSSTRLKSIRKSPSLDEPRNLTSVHTTRVDTLQTNTSSAQIPRNETIQQNSSSRDVSRNSEPNFPKSPSVKTPKCEINSCNSSSIKTSRNDVYPPLSSEEPKTERQYRRKSSVTADSRDERRRDLVAGKSVTENGTVERYPNVSLRESMNGELTDEQLKRLAIVESMMKAKKDRKKKRITQ